MNTENTKPEWAMNKREKARADAIAAGEKPKRRKGPWIVLLIVVIAAVGGYFYASTNGLLPEPPAEPEEPVEEVRSGATQLAPYEYATIAPATLTENLRVTGSLAPTHEVNLSAEISGRVNEVTAREGDAVEEGDLLASFDVESLEISLAQTRATAESYRVQVAQAESNYARTKTLVDRALSAPTNLEQAGSTLDQLKATLAAQESAIASAEDSLAKAEVYAPFSGVISDRSISAGEFVGAGSPLFTLVDVASLEVEVTAPVSKSPMIQPGQSVTFTVEGFGSREFMGTVDRIAPLANAGSRALPVYVTIENTTGALRGGMFAKGTIRLDQKADAIGVPASALREDAEGHYVLTVEDEMLVRSGVETVKTWDNGMVVEIASGLEPGDVIVSAALPELRAGQPVLLIAE